MATCKHCWDYIHSTGMKQHLRWCEYKRHEDRRQENKKRGAK